MANRAYLYFCEDVSALRFEMHYRKSDGSQRSYLDSRHQFPLAWFLFFEAQNIQLVPRENGAWQELYLVSQWPQARAIFERRVPLFLKWFEGELTQSDVDEFLRRVESLMESSQEIWLVVDPSELQIDDESNVQKLRTTFEKLDDETLNSGAKFQELDNWSGIEPFYKLDNRLKQRRDRVFGIYYGPVIPGYFLPRQSWPNQTS